MGAPDGGPRGFRVDYSRPPLGWGTTCFRAWSFRAAPCRYDRGYEYTSRRTRIPPRADPARHDIWELGCRARAGCTVCPNTLIATFSLAVANAVPDQHRGTGSPALDLTAGLYGHRSSPVSAGRAARTACLTPNSAHHTVPQVQNPHDGIISSSSHPRAGPEISRSLAATSFRVLVKPDSSCRALQPLWTPE